MPRGPGFFQINDIVLDIPPEQISVNRRSVNHSWQTLRTKSSIKVKSGYSCIDVTLTVYFTDTTQDGETLNGIQKLRDLVSQMRVTPFCYVENEFLRDSILSGDRSQTMALCLRQMEITNVPETTNVAAVSMHFAWFNYFPYTRNFSFKSDIFISQEVRDPRKSNAWKLMYKAEQRRPEWASAQHIKQIGFTSGSNYMFFNQWTTLTKQRYDLLKKEVDALKGLKEMLRNRPSKGADTGQLMRDVLENLSKTLQDFHHASSVMDQIFGGTTSMVQGGSGQDEQALIQELLAILKNQIEPGTSSKYSVIVDQDWQFAQDEKTGEFIKFSMEPGARIMEAGTQGGGPSEKDGQAYVMKRDRIFNIEESGLIVTGISISFENILATMPLIGHPYPTYQHIGSIDAALTISMMTTKEEGIQALSSFYSMVEDQAFKNRLVPQGQRNVKMVNALINLCGLEEFIPENLSIQTVPGQPGTYSAVLTMVNNPIDSKTRESLSQGQSFSTSVEMLKAINDVLMENIKLDEKRFSTSWWAGQENIDVDFELEVNKDRIDQAGAAVATGYGVSLLAGPLAPFAQALGIATAGALAISSLGNKSLYYYAPKSGDKGGRDSAFKDLCTIYARHLSDALSKIIPPINEGDIDEFTPNLQAFLAFNDSEIIGIERMQEDLVPKLRELSHTVERVPSLGANHAGAKAKGIQYIREQNRLKFKGEGQHLRDAIARWKSQRTAEDSGMKDRTLTPIEDKLERRYMAADLFVTQYLQAWLDFSGQFLPLILQKYMYLPQFDKIRALQKAAFLQSSGHAYPDFPLDQIISILKEGKDTRYKYAIKSLEEHEDALQLATRGVGAASLIGPDFYFFNRQEVAPQRIIPYHIMQSATNAVVTVHQDSRSQAEEDWFRNVYNTNILGPDKHDIMKRQLAEEVKLVAKSDQASQDAKKAVEENIRSIISQSKEFYEGDLMGMANEEYGLGSSIGMYKESGTPITLQKIDNTTDTQNFLGKRRGEVALSVNDQLWGQAKHRFGADSIKFAAEQMQNAGPPPEPEPGKDPVFTHPVEPGFVITSKYNPARPDPVWRAAKSEQLVKEGYSAREAKAMAKQLAIQAGKVRPHLANDYWHPKKKECPLLAAAPGKVINVRLPTEGRKVGTKGATAGGKAGRVIIAHENGWKSMYVHLWQDPIMERLYEQLYGLKPGQGTGGIGGMQRSGGVPVERGEPIGMMDSTGHSTGDHLHFEIWKGERGPNTLVDPQKMINGQFAAGNGISIGIDPNNDSLLTKSVEQFESDLHNGQGYTMARAYPTFRLYFVESDFGERKRFGFDDFFKYSSVKEIQLVRSRKIAADLCVIQLTNVSGALSNRKFQATDDDPTVAKTDKGTNAQENPYNPQKKDTKAENPIASLMLQPGVQLQLRLGYNANPQELETVFNGIITDVVFTENDDLVEIVCQSFAVELVQNTYGEAKTFGGFLSSSGKTGEMLEELMAAPEVVHFGRWQGQGANNTIRNVLTKRWTPVPQPQDDNIFAPTGRGIWGLFDSTPKYLLYQSTIWDVFMEMMLRHPSYVALPVPYEEKGGNPRMTMFFGVPDQYYFARDPSYQEDSVIANLKRLVDEAGSNAKTDRKPVEQVMDPDVEPDPENMKDAIYSDKDLETYQEMFKKSWIRKFSMDKGIIKPFRSYHVLTSTMHILYNNLNSSLYNTFNTTTVQYGGGSPEVNKDKKQLEFGNLKTFTLKCDAALDDEDVRELFAQYPNCVGYEQAKRYAVGLLFHSLKEGYKGSLVVMGNPRIKPYDICYIFDEYTDMFGPIEVEQVVHKFSQQNGFITEITPDMVVHVNQHSTLSTSDAMGLMAEHALKSIDLQSLPSVVKVGAGIAAASPVGALAAVGGAAALGLNYAMCPIANMFFNSSENAIGGAGSGNTLFGLVGTFIFRKQITRTQLAHPFRYSALVKNGKPMLGGLPSRKLDGSFVQSVHGFYKDYDKNVPLAMEDFFDKISPSRYVGHSTGAFWDTVWGNK